MVTTQQSLIVADTRTELFIESMQEAADNEWNSISWRMGGASKEVIGAEMKRWWQQQLRHFRTRLRKENERRRRAELKQRIRRAIRLYLREWGRRLRAEEALDQNKIALEIQKEVATYYKENGPNLN